MDTAWETNMLIGFESMEKTNVNLACDSAEGVGPESLNSLWANINLQLQSLLRPGTNLLEADFFIGGDYTSGNFTKMVFGIRAESIKAHDQEDLDSIMKTIAPILQPMRAYFPESSEIKFTSCEYCIQPQQS